MRLTHLRVKELLAHKCAAEKIDYRLNRVYERVLANGKFLGSMQKIAIAAPYGQLTLPRQFRSVEGVKINGDNFDIGNQWWEFLPGKSDCAGYSLNAIRDLGDAWAVMRIPHIEDPVVDNTIPVQDFPAGGTITITHADIVEHPVTFEGTNAAGMVIEKLVIPFKNVAIACPFSKITRIHKDTDKDYFPITITFTDADTNATVIAIMEPDEEETYYRRYMIDTLACAENVAVAALCKRRHIEITRDDTVVPLTNISGIEKCMDAIQYEDENDLVLARQYWNSGIDIFNADLDDANSAATFPVIRFWGLRGRTSHY